MASEVLRNAAEQGDAKAQSILGLWYLTDDGGHDYAKAVEWFNKAAEQGDTQAQSKLGLLYYTGKGLPKDHAKAVEWFRKAAEQGDAKAQFYMGLAYNNGHGVSEDNAKAAEWYGKAAEQGDADSQYLLGCLYINGQGVPQDSVKAMDLIKKAAAQGNEKAKDFLAKTETAVREERHNMQQMFFAAIIKAEEAGNSTEATKLIIKAAEYGVNYFQYKLGRLYYTGDGVSKDYAKAAEWFKKAAEHWNSKAQYELGRLYFYGQGVPQDYAKAVEWLRQAASSNKEAKDFLPKVEAAIEEEKKAREAKEAVVRKALEEKEAFEKLRTAAEQGDADAQYELGNLYLNENGPLARFISRDRKKAVELFSKAAAQGHMEAEVAVKQEARKAKIKRIQKIVAIAIVIATIAILIGSGVYNSQEKTVTIPDGVTIIKEGEFAHKRLIIAEIPDSVTVIEKGAFRKNKLASIKIPDTVKNIGDNAFAKNYLTSIIIGANVTLGSNTFSSDFDAFYRNNGLSAGTYKRTEPKSLEWSAWYNNFKFQYKYGNECISIIGYNDSGGDLVIPEEISGYPVKIIGWGAFLGKRFTSVIIPDSVTIIEERAFFGGPISNVTIGKNVTTIGDRAFENNSLTSVTIPNSVTSIGVSAFADNPVTSVRLGANVTLGDVGPDGILGSGTGFNGAYTNNGRRAGTYTRTDTKSTKWTRR